MDQIVKVTQTGRGGDQRIVSIPMRLWRLWPEDTIYVTVASTEDGAIIYRPLELAKKGK